MNELISSKAQDLAAKLSVSELAISDLDASIKDLQAKKKKITSELDSFKDDLREAMSKHGITRIENEEYGILFRLDKPSEVVKIEDESLIDGKFFRIKKELDKTAIKKALQVGDSVDGAVLSKGKHRLTIKA